jgi:hypothetical protein
MADANDDASILLRPAISFALLVSVGVSGAAFAVCDESALDVTSPPDVRVESPPGFVESTGMDDAFASGWALHAPSATLASAAKANELYFIETVLTVRMTSYQEALAVPRKSLSSRAKRGTSAIARTGLKTRKAARAAAFLLLPE